MTGRCECNQGAVVHNGRCGFPVACKSVGETCGSNAECCSRACNIPDGVALRCNQGMLLCNVDFDCLSGPCRGFACDGDPILLYIGWPSERGGHGPPRAWDYGTRDRGGKTMAECYGSDLTGVAQAALLNDSEVLQGLVQGRCGRCWQR